MEDSCVFIINKCQADAKLMIVLGSENSQINLHKHMTNYSSLLFETEAVVAPTFIKKLSNIQVVMGSLVTMECQLTGSLPFSVEWHKGKQRITKSAKYKLLHIGSTVSLELKLTESSDTGEYFCKVTNEAGSCTCSGVLTAKG